MSRPLEPYTVFVGGWFGRSSPSFQLSDMICMEEKSPFLATTGVFLRAVPLNVQYPGPPDGVDHVLADGAEPHHGAAQDQNRLHAGPGRGDAVRKYFRIYNLKNASYS